MAKLSTQFMGMELKNPVLAAPLLLRRYGAEQHRVVAQPGYRFQPTANIGIKIIVRLTK